MWLESCTADDEDINYDEVQVHKMEGDGIAVLVNRYHNVNPTSSHKSICIIDGDSLQQDSEVDKVYRLPGEYPETYIFDKVLERVNSTTDSVIGELTVSLHRKYEDQKIVQDTLNKVRRTNRDSHLLFSQVGKNLGFISEIVVKSAFLSVWKRKFPSEVYLINDYIKKNLD